MVRTGAFRDNRLIGAAVLFAQLSYCSSTGSQPLPSTDAFSGDLPAADVSSQQPENDAVIDSLDFVQSRRTIGQFASTIDGDHEDAGFLTAGGGAYGGIEATHTIFTSQQMRLNFPPGAKGVQTLFAPTSRPPNGSCLEMGTAYSSTPTGSTKVSFYVFDFCSGMKFVIRRLVNQTFLDQYTSPVGDARRAYRLRIYTDGKKLDTGTSWHGALFNVKKRVWEIVYSHTGLDRDARGWSIFETWYKKGQCSKSLPVLSASDVAIRNVDTGEWEELRPRLPGLVVDEHDGVNSRSANTNCFHDDPTGPASYRFRIDKHDSAWTVTSTGH